MSLSYKFIEATFRIVKSASNINFCDTNVCKDIAILYRYQMAVMCKVLYSTRLVLTVVLYLTYGSAVSQFAYLWEQETGIQLKSP